MLAHSLLSATMFLFFGLKTAITQCFLEAQEVMTREKLPNQQGAWREPD